MSTTCNCESSEHEKSGLVVVQPKASTSTWAIDRVHSTAQFKVKHMMISNVLGEFTSITGVLERDENDVTKSKIRASIDADTINTREPQRDAHLKSADFFHVEKHPA
jgi:polyisoprenoid-binding protein YceI